MEIAAKGSTGLRLVWSGEQLHTNEASTLKDQAEAFLFDRRLANKGQATIDLNSYALQSLLSSIGNIPVATITVTHLRNHFNSLYQRNLSPATIKSHYSSLSCFFQYLVREKLAETNLIRRIPKPKLPKRLPGFLSLEQVAAILNICPRRWTGERTWIGIRNQTIVAFFYGTGLRCSELVNLNLDSINASTGIIRVIGKGDRERVVFVDLVLDAYLSNWLNERAKRIRHDAGDPLFVSRSGRRLSRMQIYKMIVHLGELVGIQRKIKPHDLRHSYATHFIRNGGDINHLQRLLGHSTIKMTEHYIHLGGGDLQKSAISASPLASLPSNEQP